MDISEPIVNAVRFLINNSGVTAILIAILVWWLNERSKRQYDEYIRREKRYSALLQCLKGFYVGSSNPQKLKQEFLDQLDQCWLYCPDNVIRKGYDFLMTVHTNNNVSDKEKENTLQEFILEIRKDLYGRGLFWQLGPFSKTKLKREDYKILKVN